MTGGHGGLPSRRAKKEAVPVTPPPGRERGSCNWIGGGGRQREEENEKRAAKRKEPWKEKSKVLLPTRSGCHFARTFGGFGDDDDDDDGGWMRGLWVFFPTLSTVLSHAAQGPTVVPFPFSHVPPSSYPSRYFCYFASSSCRPTTRGVYAGPQSALFFVINFMTDCIRHPLHECTRDQGVGRRRRVASLTLSISCSLFLSISSFAAITLQRLR